VHTDDISQVLILNKKSISNYETQLFEQELEKFRPYQNLLLQANVKQSQLMKELTTTFNALLQDKRVRSEQSKYEAIQRQRSSVINRYKRAYQEFLDLEAGLQSAKNWYSEMRETVSSLEKNVDTFVNNRRAEGAQLLNQIEEERSTSNNSQAERERERLRGLMERMSMEPAKATAQGATSGRPTPAQLFQPGQGPRYPQTNFQGQYQVATSPPPKQAKYPGYTSPPPQNSFSPPMTYDPSQYGRTPGPTSPPPNQTSFGVNLMPHSPPPTQTSFGQTHQHQGHQTYGNYGMPQPQQQAGYVPPGFVPPPPPPGPPPLGPQQTFHYDGGHGGQPQSAQPRSAQPQQPYDPWAGLNSWK
jgi:hypothetical protein